MTRDPIVRIEMFSRPGCHLCDDAAEVIRRMQRRFAFRFDVINIESDPDLEARFGGRIPVVHIDGRPMFQYRVDPDALEKEVERLWNR